MVKLRKYIYEAISFLPDSLALMLKTMFPSKDGQVKVASLGQAVMQATHPRTILAPLQVGLGVQLHHHFASKFIVDSLCKHGFCCSHLKKVTKCVRNAAVNQGTDIPGFTPGHFVQYVADNVDHNVRTIDGMNTFHGMGMIAATTPSKESTQRVPRINIAAIGTVNITPFMPTCDGMQSLCYEELQNIQKHDPTSRLDALWRLSISVRSPRPSWSGMMQMVHTGDHPGQSSVLFLPMIYLDPGNMSCVHSTLKFICEHAARYNVTPIITFDQPLWWKSLQVIEGFIGSIGHLMVGSGLQELLETIYADNAVTHMLTGKAIQRAFRGLILVDSALSAMLVSDEFNVKAP